MAQLDISLKWCMISTNCHLFLVPGVSRKGCLEICHMGVADLELFPPLYTHKEEVRVTNKDIGF